MVGCAERGKALSRKGQEMDKRLWINLHLVEHAEIDGRQVFHYIISSGIGYFNIVEYETSTKELKRFMFEDDYEIAERKFKVCCKWIMSGK